MSRANDFEKIPAEKERFILQMMSSKAPFPNFLGMRFEEVRLDYGRSIAFVSAEVETASGKTLAQRNMA